MRIVVELPKRSFDFSRAHGAPASVRSVLIDQRKLQLMPDQDAMAIELAKRGGKNIERYWLANQVGVDIPSTEVASLAKLPGVVSLSAAGTAHNLAVPYSGVEIRNGTRAGQFLSWGLRGQDGSRLTGGRIVLGILETQGDGPNAAVRDHLAYGDGPSPLPRWIGHVDCTSDPCVNSTASTDGSHGMTVAAVAAASIEEGQDPDITLPTARIRSSGVLPEALIRYYMINSCESVSRALEIAANDGVDVINMSFWCRESPTGWEYCDPARNVGGLNATLASALDWGMVPVGAAGNRGDAEPGCSLAYPNYRTEVLNVGALDTSSNYLYSSTTKATWSSKGPLPIETTLGGSVTTSGVDLLAPGVIVWMAQKNHPDVNFRYWACDPPDCVGKEGTSFAAPIVAGGVGLIKNALYAGGYWEYVQPRYVMLDTLLAGDGYDGTVWPSTEMQAGTSSKSGTGRLRLHRPSGDDLTAPWVWGHVPETQVHQLGEYCFFPFGQAPASASYTEWKWAVMWNESDLLYVNDVDLKVYNACSGVPRTLITDDTSYNLRGRIRLAGAELTGKCIQACLLGYSTIPAGVPVWSAWYAHSGATDEH